MTEKQRAAAVAGLKASIGVRGTRGKSRLNYWTEQIEVWSKDGKTQIQIVNLLEANGLRISRRWLGSWLKNEKIKRKKRSVKQVDETSPGFVADVVRQVLRAMEQKGRIDNGRVPPLNNNQFSQDETEKRLADLRNKKTSLESKDLFVFDESQPLNP